MDYTPPLAIHLIEEHEELLIRLAREAIQEDVEHAVTLSARPGEQRLSASEDAEGSERGVTSPGPKDGADAVVRLHTHPKETQVTFSTQDILAFVNSTLADAPFSTLSDRPNGYGVVGRRGDDVSEAEAHLQTLEPTQAWVDLGVLERDRLRRRVRSTAATARTANEDNPLFDLLEPYITRSSVEFSTAERLRE